MQVILFGSTGFVGREVLNRCLSTPAITSIIAISRRTLSEEVVHPKLTVIILEDFGTYPASVLERVKDADACIWSLGTYNWDTTVELEYPEAFQQALIATLDGRRPFRYVYLGGAFTEPDQDKSLWFFSEGRRGLAQKRFLEFARQHEYIEAHVVRPGAILRGDGSAVLELLLPTVSVRKLAAVMVDLVVNGGSGDVVGHQDIVRRGTALVKS